MSNYNILIPIPIYSFVVYETHRPEGDEISDEKSPNKGQEEVYFDAGIQINLTAEDLQEAGYHNDRTPWQEAEDSKLLAFAKNSQLTWN